MQLDYSDRTSVTLSNIAKVAVDLLPYEIDEVYPWENFENYILISDSTLVLVQL
jgi:hypothetical protein